MNDFFNILLSISLICFVLVLLPNMFIFVPWYRWHVEKHYPSLQNHKLFPSKKCNMETAPFELSYFLLRKGYKQPSVSEAFIFISGIYRFIMVPFLFISATLFATLIVWLIFSLLSGIWEYIQKWAL